MTVATSTSCSKCNSVGLPFLLLRKSVIATNKSLAPKDGDKVVDHQRSTAAMNLPALSHSRYVLRLLRESKELTDIQGFLHVFHKVPPLVGGKPKAWQIFRVKKGGMLVPVEAAEAFNTQEETVCSRNPSHPHDLRMYVLPNPLKATDVYFAYSANMWGAAIREKIESAPEKAMVRINVPQILSGSLPDIALPLGKPEAAKLIETHVAEYALDGFKIDNRPPFYHFASSAREGEAASLVRIAQSRTDDHPKLKEKACAIVLPDPVGVTAELGDLVMARHMQGMSLARSLAHPMGAAQAIGFIKKQVYDETLDRLQKAQPLTQDSLVFADGKKTPLIEQLSFPDKLPLPPVTEYPKWVRMGVVRYENFIDYKQTKEQGELSAQGKYAYGLYPPSARWYFMPLYKDPGMVIALASEAAAIQSVSASSKINRIHDAKALENFEKYYEAEMVKVQDSVEKYDADRAKWLEKPWLRDYFALHFATNDPGNPKNPFYPERPVLPSHIYMREAVDVVIGMGHPTASTEKIFQALVDKDIQTPESWLLRASVGNSSALFGPVGEFAANQAQWLTSEDYKLDKTYDSYKGLIFGEVSFDGIEANNKKIFDAALIKHPWLNQAGIGLSFGVTGFIAGTLGGLAKATPKGQIILATFNAFNAHALARAQLFQAMLTRSPPARPVIARMQVDLITLPTIMAGRQAAGDTLNRATRQALGQLQNLPAGSRPPSITLEFVTTDEAIKNAAKKSPAMQDVAVAVGAGATHVRVPVRTLGANANLWNVSTEQVARLYNDAHRFDALKRYVGGPVKGIALSLYGGLLTDGAGNFKLLQNKEAMFGLFGAFLQWRVFQKNWDAQEKLKAALQKTIDANGKAYTPEQIDALNYALAITRAGVADNIAGMTGGVMEVLGAGANAMMAAGKLASVGSAAWPASAALGLASIAGAAGAFANAAQNYTKFQKKLKDDDYGMTFAYGAVTISYGLASVSLAAAGGETLLYFIANKQLLKSAIIRTGAAAATRAGFASAAGMTVRVGSTAVSLTGIGLAITFISFAIEGVVIYYDRTKLEEWIEKSYFGNKAQWRRDTGTPGVNAQGKPMPGIPKPELWQDEYKALEAALKDAQADAVVQEVTK